MHSQRGGAYGNSRPNHAAGNSPAPAIRAGLSVQELKAMTAMRMASADDHPNRPIVAPQRNSSSIASSYQTASPQQLVSAGILPVVINDRNSRSRNGGRSAQPESMNSYSNSPLMGNSSVGRQGVSQLSAYHQQLLPRRGPSQDTFGYDSFSRGPGEVNWPGEGIHSKTNNSFSDRSLPYPESMNSDGRAYPRHMSNGPIESVDFLSGDMSNYSTRSTRGPSTSSKSSSDYFDFRDNRGPEVRSPPARFSGGGDMYNASTGYESASQGGMNVLKDSLATLALSSASGDTGYRNDQSSRYPFHKSRSQSNIDNSFLGMSEARPHLPVLPSLDIREPPSSNDFDFDLGGFDRSANLRGPPLLKSKTAPKLGALESSPATSPSMRMLAKKLLGGKDLRIESSLLPDEMAEMVLGTPPASTNTRLASKKLVRAPSFGPGSFFADDGANDDRFAWDVSLEDDHAAAEDGLDALVEERAQ